MKNMMSRSLLLVAITSLSGCSSRPGTADLSSGLADLYSCPVLENINVRKENGREIDGQYLVEFSFSLGFKGGEEGAKSFLTHYILFERGVTAKEAAIREMPDKYGSNLERSQAAEVDLIEFRKSFRGLDDCTLPAQAIVLGMATATSQRIQKAQGQSIRIPVAQSMHGTALFAKTEKGWAITAPPEVSLDQVENSSTFVQI